MGTKKKFGTSNVLAEIVDHSPSVFFGLTLLQAAHHTIQRSSGDLFEVHRASKAFLSKIQFQYVRACIFCPIQGLASGGIQKAVTAVTRRGREVFQKWVLQVYTQRVQSPQDFSQLSVVFSVDVFDILQIFFRILTKRTQIF
jgi:hypothetical protein